MDAVITRRLLATAALLIAAVVVPIFILPPFMTHYFRSAPAGREENVEFVLSLVSLGSGAVIAAMVASLNDRIPLYIVEAVLLLAGLLGLGFAFSERGLGELPVASTRFVLTLAVPPVFFLSTQTLARRWRK